jgi:hypothetical protein
MVENGGKDFEPLRPLIHAKNVVAVIGGQI